MVAFVTGTSAVLNAERPSGLHFPCGQSCKILITAADPCGMVSVLLPPAGQAPAPFSCAQAAREAHRAMEDALTAGKDEVMKVKARYDALSDEIAALGRRREAWQAEEAESRQAFEEERRQLDAALQVGSLIDWSPRIYESMQAISRPWW